MKVIQGMIGAARCSLFLGFLLAQVLDASAQLKLPQAAAGAPALSAVKEAKEAKPSPSAGKEVSLDSTVAIVDKQVLTAYDLATRKKIILFQLQGRQDLPDAATLDKQILDRMINDAVQMDAAEDAGISVDDATMDLAMKRLASERKLSVEAFHQALQKAGIGLSQFTNEIKKEIIIARLREREVGSKIEISDADIDNFLATVNNAAGGTQYHVAHILIEAPENTPSTELRQLELKAKQMYRRITIGQPFAEVARNFSDADDAKQGGDLGWRTADKLPALFAKRIRTMKAGEVSEVIRADNGFHVLKLLEVKQAVDSEPVTQTHARHILIRENEVLSEKDAQAKLESIRQSLQNGADFEKIARLNSNDASSIKGGDLGWLSPGDTVPEFEKAMDALAINEISPVVKSAFGYHLIQVLERRQANLSEEKSRQAARATLYQTKLEEAYEEWLQQLRDRAYVDIRLEQ